MLGPRLHGCTAMVLDHPHRKLRKIFGTPDDLKFRSSMTLFDAASAGDIFAQALDIFCDGARDALSLELLKRAEY